MQAEIVYGIKRPPTFTAMESSKAELASLQSALPGEPESDCYILVKRGLTRIEC